MKFDNLDNLTIDRAIEIIKTLTAERDEARREVCQWEHHWDKTASEQYYADKRGWDCYKKDALDRLHRLDEECGL